MKKIIKIIHQISEGILFLFLILAIFDGVKDLISYEKDPSMYYLVGVSLLVYICFWQKDSVLGQWVYRNDIKDKENKRLNELEDYMDTELNKRYKDKKEELN